MLAPASPFGSWETVRPVSSAFYPHADLLATPGYLLLGMLSSLVFRAIRDALPGNPAAQERILGASLLAMAIADASDPFNHLAP